MRSTRLLDVTKHSPRGEKLSRSLHLVGQDEAVKTLVNTVDLYEGGLYPRTKPISCLLFLGPTGSGKTYAVESFCESMFGNPQHMIKIDCAEFQMDHEITKLIGSPPGYLGHRETHAIITNEKIKNLQQGFLPFPIILLDEIEKASDTLWNLLLGILDKGILTLGTNEVVDLKSTIIIMTSNVGSKEMSNKLGGDTLGFLNPCLGSRGDTQLLTELKDTAVSAARKKFTPEFMNRLTEIVMFNSLTKDNLKEIVELEIGKARELIAMYGLKKPSVVISEPAKAQLLEEGYEPKYGARHVKRTIEKQVLLPVSRAMASHQIDDLTVVVIDHKDGAFVYRIDCCLTTERHDPYE